MSYETPFACITNDTGLVSEILHVSPMFVRYGPPVRGRFDERRLARVRRSEARWEQRTAVSRRRVAAVEAGRFTANS